MVEILEALRDLFEHIEDRVPWLVKWAVPIITIATFYFKRRERQLRHIRNEEMRSDIRAIKQHLGVEECANISNPTSDPLANLGKGGYIFFSAALSIVRYASRFIIYLIRRVPKMNNVNWTTLLPGLISCAKLVLQSFGIDIPDEHINSVVNGAAAVVSIIAIFMSHKKDGGASNEPTKYSGDHGAAV